MEIIYPNFLNSYGSLKDHLDGQFSELETSDKSQQKGRRFVEFCLKLLPQIEEFQKYSNFRENPKKTHDKGVDIFGKDQSEEETFFAQAKYSIVLDLFKILIQYSVNLNHMKNLYKKVNQVIFFTNQKMKKVFFVSLR
jgi:hypothetical protein